MIIVLQMLIFFRESLVTTLDRLIRPYYKHFSLSLPFYKYEDGSDEDESEEQQVFAEFDEEKGVVFFPPVYSQRYAAVCDCLMDERWCGKLEKVVEFGYHDISFIKYLKDVPGIKCILGVDIESIPLQCSPDLIYRNDCIKRENPLQITLFQGNAADPDYRLIGCDGVIAIEMIEHMLPHDLDRIIHTVFGFIKPRIAVFTTPNADFNVLFKALEANGLRRLDHFFEWTREQFSDWCSNIVTRYPQYTVSCKGIGPGPPGTEHLGCCSQLALFVSKDYHKQQDLNLNSLALVESDPKSDKLLTGAIGDWMSSEQINSICDITGLNCTSLQVRKFSKTSQGIIAKHQVEDNAHVREVVDRVQGLTKMLNIKKENFNQELIGVHTWSNFNWGENAPYWNQFYKIVGEYNYPYELKSVESQIFDMVTAEISRQVDLRYNNEELAVGDDVLEIPLSHVMEVVKNFTDDVDRVRDVLEWNGYELVGDKIIHRRLAVDDRWSSSLDEDIQKETASDVK